VSWIEKVSIQINELQTIMEIDVIADTKASKSGLSGFSSLQEDDDSLIHHSDAANWGV
jgi:hypothetical protein